MMKKLLLALFFLPAIIPGLASAASASLVLDTGSQTINTLEATIHIPSDLNIDKIDNGSSALIIWIKSPTIDNVSHTITFTGLTPGGFRGVKPVFSITGDFKASDLQRFYISGVTALLNDGKGTSAKVKLSMAAANVEADKGIPDTFVPAISSSAGLFNGEPFLSFLAQDKGSGILRYEYAAVRIFSPGDNDWQAVESPFLIPKSDLSKKLYVRALDREGNAQISSVSGPHRKLWFGEWGIIFVLLIACVLYFRRRFF